MSQSLAAAAQHHRCGRLKEAAAIYRQILRREPGNAEALHLFGLLAHQSGDHEAAVESIARAVAVDPRSALYRFNLGVVLSAKGDLDGAIARYREALAVDPQFADASNNLGLVLQTQGKTAEAIECFDRATRSNPRHAEAFVNLGRALLEQAKAAEALAHFERAVSLKPALAEAHFGVGKCLEDQRAWDEATACYRQALALKPDFPEARNNLGTALLARGEYGEAQAVFRRLLEMTRGPICAAPADLDAERPGEVEEAPSGPRALRLKIVDRIEQLEYLLAKGRIDRSFTALISRYRATVDALGDESGLKGAVALDREQSRRSDRFCNRVVHLADAPGVASGAVNDALDCNAIEDAYLASPTPVVYFDDFLTPEALSRLRRFCLESTVFFGADPGGYVSSYIRDGFNCDLLYQIAEELKQRFPRVIGSQFLTNMWAYRHQNRCVGVDAHTDYAAVTFNFWITPDAANLRPGHGGIVVYQKEEPFDWDWMAYNRNKNAPDVRKRIASFLESAGMLAIPYRENRAVLFHSNLFHKSDEIDFEPGFENRRVNVSMLFGERGVAMR